MRFVILEINSIYNSTRILWSLTHEPNLIEFVSLLGHNIADNGVSTFKSKFDTGIRGMLPIVIVHNPKNHFYV